MFNLLSPLAILSLAFALCGNGGSQSQSSPTSVENKAANVAAKPAVDKASVQRELVSLANDILDASHRGKKEVIEAVLTDDFEATDIEGKVMNRRQTIAEMKEEKAIKTWAITEPEVTSFDENSAVLRYLLTVKGTNGGQAKARVSDTYVKKDGKWMLKNQQQTLVR
jgi:hypothetical protein